MESKWDDQTNKPILQSIKEMKEAVYNKDGLHNDSSYVKNYVEKIMLIWKQGQK